MPFTDVINDYTNGSTGVLTTTDGGSVNYAITGTSANTDWQGLVGGARVNGDGSQQFSIAFDEAVIGATMQFSGSDASEAYYIVLNGVTADLNSLIANGDVTFTQSGAATHVIRPDGGINGGHYSDGSIAELRFNIPVDSLGAFGSGANAGNWDFVEVGIDSTSFTVACFTADTLINTKYGPVTARSLSQGDMVQTAQDGFQALRWVAKTNVTKEQLSANRKLHPVKISEGALGRNMPERDLLVSRQHRMLVSSKIAERMFGTAEVLVAAIKLTELPGISVDETLSDVTYVHFMFDKHQIVFAEGAPSESLLPGPEALASVSPAARLELQKLFPELADMHGEPAVHLPEGYRQRAIIARHKKNQKPILENYEDPIGLDCLDPLRPAL